MALALKVLKERLRPSHKWGPAVEILPRDFTYHPTGIEPEDLALLEGSPVYFSAIFSYTELVINYVQLYRHFIDNEATCKLV